MKKFFLMSMFALLAFGAAAAEPAAPAEAVKAEPVKAYTLPPPVYPWTFINLQFFPGVPTDAGYMQTNGVKVGAPVSAGEAPVYGGALGRHRRSERSAVQPHRLRCAGGDRHSVLTGQHVGQGLRASARNRELRR